MICTTPGCPNITPRGRCTACRAPSRKRADQKRGTARARGYDNRWARTRAAYLADHPTCECDACESLPYGRRPPAVDVHHLDGQGPHGPRGHDPTNLAAYTHGHHARETAAEQAHPFHTRYP